MSGGTEKEIAQKDVSTALASALSPICVDKFQHSADAASNLIELEKVSSWQQSSFVENGGWATMPSGEPANAAVAQPAPRCSAVFKSNLANAASAVVDGGVSVGSIAQTSRGTQ